MTWKDLLTVTLRDLRVYGSTGNLSPADLALALEHLNEWIDSLKTDSSAVYEQVRTTWALSTASSYAVGTGAAVNVQRPVSPQLIAGIGFIDTSITNTPEICVNVPLTPTERQSIAAKSFQGLYPTRWFYEATVPTGTLYPYPIPTSSTLQGVMYSGVSVEEVTNVNADLVLPPGYRGWIRKSLKVQLADPFKAPVSDATFQRWERERDDAAAAVRRQNERLEEVSMGLAGAVFGASRGPSNIYTGQ